MPKYNIYYKYIMPWPFNVDENNKSSKERLDAIKECKRCWSYESPFPDYDIIEQKNLKNRDIYSKLDIDYSCNNELINKITNKYIDDWIVTKQEETFIKLKDEFKDCDFTFGKW